MRGGKHSALGGFIRVAKSAPVAANMSAARHNQSPYAAVEVGSETGSEYEQLVETMDGR